MPNERTNIPGIAPAFAGSHDLSPLFFDPAKLPGPSERLIRSRLANHDRGATSGWIGDRRMIGGVLGLLRAFVPRLFGGPLS